MLLLQSLFRKYENRQIVVSGQAAFKPMKLDAKPILSVTMLVCFSDFLDDNNPMRCYNQPTFIEKWVLESHSNLSKLQSTEEVESRSKGEWSGFRVHTVVLYCTVLYYIVLYCIVL